MNIKIYYYNELYLKIETEKSIEYDLRDEFSFYANNYKHMSKFKYGIWDGKIRLYNSKDKTLYIGLLSDLYSYAKKNGITITINDGDKEKFKPLITYDEKWIDNVFHKDMFTMTLKDYQLNSFKEITKFNKVLILSPTGCHAKGQGILMYDGTIKKVEDIVVGDLLMGDDSTPRKVLTLHRGQQEMRKIIPRKGNSFIVNKDHILSLRYTSDENRILNETVNEYENSSNYHKHMYKLYRTKVDFPKQETDLEIDPYFLGVMLGDGCFKDGLSVCNSNKTLQDYIEQFLTKENIKFRIDRFEKNHNDYSISKLSSLYEKFNECGLTEKLSDSKFIPHEYKVASRENRLLILAGLLDTDGYNHNNCFEYVTKSSQLMDDVIFIARSLGFACYKKEFTSYARNTVNKNVYTYYSCQISGDTDLIPTKINYKQASKRKQIKNVLNTGFSVEKLPVDDYYGFEVDGNNLYVMDDFTVTHNSGKSALIYTLVRYLIDIDIVNSNNRLLINVPSITLVNQLYQDFIDYTKDNFDISKYITRAGGDNTEELKLPVVISTWQTTMRKDDSYFENVVAYVLDEAHQATANEITKIIDKMPFCKIRIGTTGTLDGTDMHEMAMRGRFGKLYQAATSKELMERGDLTKLSIDAHILKYDEEKIKELYKNIKSLDPTQKYQSELEFIINNDVRTKYLIDLAFSYEENTLMLFNFIEKHGKKMLDIMLPLQDKNLRRVYFIYGGVKGDEREIIRTTLDKKPPVWYDLYISENEFIRIRGEQYIVLSNGENISGFDLKLVKKYEIDINWIKNKISNNTIYFNINDINNFSNKVIKIKKRVGCSVLLASYGTLAVGVNIKNLHNLIFCHPVKSQIRLLQSIGRVLRKCNNKNLVNVIDIVDDMTYETKKKEYRNTLLKQFVERLKIYDNQEFDYNIQKVEL